MARMTVAAKADPTVAELLAALAASERGKAAAERGEAEAKRGEAEAKRVTVRTKRLGVLSHLKGPQLNSKSTVSLKEKVVYTKDTRAVLRGFARSEDEDRVCDRAWAQVRSFVREAPPEDAAEVAHVHPFVLRVVNAIAAAAAALGVKCNKAFDEYDAVAPDGRADLLFTQWREQLHCALNKLFFLEIKPRKRKTEGPNVLWREGEAQVINRLATRHEESAFRTTLGISMVTNGAGVVLVRINFTDDGSDTAFPLLITDPQPLLGSEDDTTCPTGLRWLVRLMLAQDVKQFGLPLHGGFTAPAPYTHERMLGEGGFGIVCEVKEGDRVHYALKSMREAGADAMLEKEAAILAALATTEAPVPRVPTLVTTVRDTSTGRLGLVMSPVGEPLLKYVATMETAAERLGFARMVLAQVHETLCAAHKKGILHGDVRPSNMIVVGAAGGGGGAAAAAADVYLVDWGIGDTAATSSKARERKELHGVRAFMADDRVRWDADASVKTWKPLPEHDMHALLYTYAAIAGHKHAEPPWNLGYVGSDAAEALIVGRRDWLAKPEQEVLGEGVPGTLRTMWNNISGVASHGGAGRAASGGGGTA